MPKLHKQYVDVELGIQLEIEAETADQAADLVAVPGFNLHLVIQEHIANGDFEIRTIEGREDL